MYVCISKRVKEKGDEEEAIIIKPDTLRAANIFVAAKECPKQTQFVLRVSFLCVWGLGNLSLGAKNTDMFSGPILSSVCMLGSYLFQLIPSQGRRCDPFEPNDPISVPQRS